MAEDLKCCICGTVIPNPIHSNNAWPIKDGRCCGDCNSMLVIPARMVDMGLIKKEK